MREAVRNKGEGRYLPVRFEANTHSCSIPPPNQHTAHLLGSRYCFCFLLPTHLPEAPRLRCAAQDPLEGDAADPGASLACSHSPAPSTNVHQVDTARNLPGTNHSGWPSGTGKRPGTGERPPNALSAGSQAAPSQPDGAPSLSRMPAAPDPRRAEKGKGAQPLSAG